VQSTLRADAAAERARRIVLQRGRRTGGRGIAGHLVCGTVVSRK
jgi:hypothetical protein